MAEISLDNIIEATGGRFLGRPGISFSGVSIDSRAITGSDLFFAIRGDRFDGHDFLDTALSVCAGAVVERIPVSFDQDKTLIYVKDTLRALQDLAHYIRSRCSIPVVAVTGSNGKTTTKEMLWHVLSSKFRTHRNEGNLNNHIGLPLSIMKLASDDEAMVLEMGMNAAGEIRRLCEIAEPGYGIITNVGLAHIGMLGTQRAVRDAKLEMLQNLGTAVLNSDDDYLMQGVRELKDFEGEIITFGIDSDADVRASDLVPVSGGINFTLQIRNGDNAMVTLRASGTFNVYNALAAAAVGYALGMDAGSMASALSKYRGVSMRFEIIPIAGMILIDDSYNANPGSVTEALRELVHLAEGRRVAVLGDMGELGDHAESAHSEIVHLAATQGIEVFVAVGRMMSRAAEEVFKERENESGLEVYQFGDSDTAAAGISKILRVGDTLLVKGSRSMQMDIIVRSIKNAV